MITVMRRSSAFLILLALTFVCPFLFGCGQKDDSKAGIEPGDIVFKMPPNSKFNARKKQAKTSGKDAAAGGD